MVPPHPPYHHFSLTLHNDCPSPISNSTGSHLPRTPLRSRRSRFRHHLRDLPPSSRDYLTDCLREPRMAIHTPVLPYTSRPRFSTASSSHLASVSTICVIPHASPQSPIHLPFKATHSRSTKLNDWPVALLSCALHLAPVPIWHEGSRTVAPGRVMMRHPASFPGPHVVGLSTNASTTIRYAFLFCPMSLLALTSNVQDSH